MSSAYGDIPSNAPGPIILNAQLYAAPGKADVIQGLLSDIQRFALSDKEPGCLLYRTARSYVADQSGITKFIVFEQYKDEVAVQAHFKSDEFKALAAEIGKIGKPEGSLVKPPTIEYFNEFGA